MLLASVPPRLPQPTRPTRTAELAALPRTSCGLNTVNAVTAPAARKKSRRPVVCSLMAPLSPNQFFQVRLGLQDVGPLPLTADFPLDGRSEEHTSELQSPM